MASRTKNATRNIAFGMALKIYQIFVPFLLRTAMIYLMGMEYVGLNGLFTSILQVLNLAELGVGSAMVFSMYKPIAQKDESSICALLKLYKIYYRIIGSVIGVAGLAITPFVPYLIKKDVPSELNIYILYILNLSATVASYWLFAYKSSLLHAHQRNDITSKVRLFTNTVQYIFQIIALWKFHDYYAYVMISLIMQVANNLIVAYYASKIYPNYQPVGILSREEKDAISKRVRSLFTAKIGSVVTKSVDTIVISAFLGLTTLAYYQNYYYVMNSLYGLTIVIFRSVTAGMGNSLISESPEKNYNDLKKFTLIVTWVTTIFVCCLAVMYQPFMIMWVGRKNLLDDSFVYLFCVYFFVLTIAMIWATAKDAAGIWYQDRFRPLIGASANLIMNLIMVNSWGLYGIILSTVLSYLFISMPWLVHNVFKYIYKRSSKEYVLKLFLAVLTCIVSCFLSVIICKQISAEGLPGLLLYGAIAFFIANVVQLIAFYKLPEFNDSVKMVGKVFGLVGKKWKK